jgi:hypothetical protein
VVVESSAPAAIDAVPSPKRKQTALVNTTPVFPERALEKFGALFVSQAVEPPPDTDLLMLHGSGLQPAVIGVVKHETDRRSQVIKPPAQRAREGTLAPVTQSHLNYDAIRDFDAEDELLYQGIDVLSILTDPNLFLKYCATGIDPTEKRPTRISRHMMRHADSMMSYGIVSQSVTPEVLMPVFTVSKKIPTDLRLILDCRWLNERCERPPPMHLPTIHEVIDYLLDHEWASTCDARSYFYQFHLAAEIQRYFGCRLAAERGMALLDLVFQKLPMGFSWAPAISQRVSNVLVRGLGKAWIDNFILAAKSEEQLEKSISTFRTRLATANVVADDADMKPTQRLEVLGLDVDLEFKRYRLSATFAAKAQSLNIRASMTIRHTCEAIGILVWGAFVRGTPLCHFPHSLKLLSTASEAASNCGSWDASVSLTTDQVRELTEALADVAHNRWVTRPTVSGGRKATVWADSSGHTGAFVVVADEIALVINKLDVTKFGEGDRDNIFVKELVTAAAGIICARTLGFNDIEVMEDNSAAYHALRKRHSSVFFANEILSAVFDDPSVRVTQKWVPSELQLADPFTRGVTVPSGPVKLKAIQRVHELFQQQQREEETKRQIYREPGRMPEVAKMLVAMECPHLPALNYVFDELFKDDTVLVTRFAEAHLKKAVRKARHFFAQRRAQKTQGPSQSAIAAANTIFA